MTVHQLPHGKIIRARVEAVYPTIEIGSVTLVISDGPYGLRLAEWDKVKDLAAFYRPHIAEWSRICAPSASVYLCGTAEGWAEIHPEMVRAGWTFTSLITWVKPNAPAIKGTAMARSWPDITEVCGFYMRESIGAEPGGAQVLVNEAAGASARNTIRQWLHTERARAGLTGDALEAAVNEAGGKGNMICRHSFTESQWLLPTLEQWCALHTAWNRRGDPAGRPYLQRDQSRVFDLAVRAEYDALRAEYDALRAPFALPVGVQNVWTAPLVAGEDRLMGEDGTTLHVSQKPMAWAERMITASTRPGNLVFVPFGGTCREAVACESIAHHWPEKARRYVVVEQDEDGKEYIAAVLRQMATGATRADTGRPQTPLFAPRP